MDFAAQFMNACLHTIGLQKTKCNVARVWDILDYHIFAAKATPTGAVGIELWVMRSFILLQHCHALLAQPRRLLVKLLIACGILHCYVEHALDIQGYGVQ